MELEKLINEDIKQAMLQKDVEKLEALRSIKAALLLEKTGKDVSSGPIPESVELKLLQRLVKQRKESAAIFEAQNRPELVKTELFQASIIEKYLPSQLSEQEIIEIINNAIASTGASSIKDMGKVMGMANNEIAGRAESKVVAELIKKILG